MAPRRNGLPAPGGLFESTGNRARQLAAGNPGVSGFNDRGVTDFSAGINALNAAVQDIQLQRDSVKGVGVETEATVQAQKDTAALNPLDKDYQEQVKVVWDNAKKRVMESGISSAAVLDDLSKRMDRHGAAMQIHAIGQTKDAVNKQAQLSYGDAVDAASAKILRDPANANLYADELRADVERLKPGMDPIAFETLSRKAADNLTKAQIQGYAEKGNFAAARNTLKAQAEHLGADRTNDMSRYIDGRESKARADGDRARTANAADVLLSIEDQFNGRKPIDPNMREKLDDMRAKGMISPEQHLQAVKIYNNENQRYVAQAREVAVAMEEMVTTGPSSQKNADLAFDNQFGRIPFGAIAQSGTPEQKAAAITLAVSMASGSGGYLPGSMKTMVANADQTTDPKRAPTVAYAAEAVDEMEAKGVSKIAGVTLSDTGVVNRTRAEAKRLIADGVPKQEAYTIAAQSQMPKDKMTLQQETDNLARADDLLKKINPSQQALGAVTTFAQRNIPFVAAPEVTANMSAEWTRVFKDGMKATNGDEVRAKALADKKIGDTFGQTLVGVTDARQFTPSASPGATYAGPYAATYAGAETTSEGMVGQGKVSVQKHPPEKYMPFPNLSPEQKAKVIMAELDVFNKKHNVAPSPDKDLPGAPVVRLLADAQTEADIRAGRPPSYQYHILKGTLYEPIPTANGPARYRVPSNPDQLKDNPAYQAAEKTRIDDFNKKQALDIELKTQTPDALADERLKRMREEGRRFKQRSGDVGGTVEEISKNKNFDRLMSDISQGPESKNVIVDSKTNQASVRGDNPSRREQVEPPTGFNLPSKEEMQKIIAEGGYEELKRAIYKAVSEAANESEKRRLRTKKD